MPMPILLSTRRGHLVSTKSQSEVSSDISLVCAAISTVDARFKLCAVPIVPLFIVSTGSPHTLPASVLLATSLIKSAL